MAAVQYTAEEKKRIEEVLGAFNEYISGNEYFEILSSRLLGYIWVQAIKTDDGQYKDGHYYIIHTAEDLYYKLFCEIHTDVILELREKDSDKDRFDPEDIELLRHRVEAYIDNMSDSKESYLSYLEQSIKDVMKDPYIV